MTNAIRIQALLKTMLKSVGDKEFIIKHFQLPILEELNVLKFVVPDNLKEYDLVYKNFIRAVIKNYIYEQSEENKASISDLVAFLASVNIVDE